MLPPPARFSVFVKNFLGIFGLSPLFIFSLLTLPVPGANAQESITCPNTISKGIDTAALTREIKTYSAILKANPASPETIENYIKRGSVREKLNDREGAIDDFNQYLWFSRINAPAFRNDLLVARAYYLRGQVYLEDGKVQKALEDFTNAIKFNPHYSSAYAGRAIAYSSLGDAEEALENYKRYIGYETDNPRAYYDRAKLRVQFQDYNNALKDYDLAILYQPDLIEAYYDRAMLRERSGIKGALADYQVVLKCRPNLFLLAKNSPAAYQSRAKIQIEIADNLLETSDSEQTARQAVEYYTSAIQDLETAIRFDPEYDKLRYARAFLRRGYAKIRLNENQSALQDYNQAVFVRPEYAEAYLYRGLMRANRYGDHAGAVEDFTEATRLDRDDRAAFYHRGLALYKIGRFPEALESHNIAIKDYNRSGLPRSAGRVACSENIRESATENYTYSSRESDLKPNYDISCYFQARGDARFALKDFNGAEKDYTAYILAFPNDPDGYQKRANARFEKGDKQGAIEDYNTFLQKARDARIYYSRGNSRADVGDKGGSITDFTRSLQINPEDVTVYSNRGNARVDTGSTPDRLTVRPRPIPENPIALNNRGIIRRQTGDVEGALTDLDKAVSLNPNDPTVYNNRAVARFDGGNSTGAIEDLNKAIALKSNYVEAYYNRGLVLEQQGKKAEAIADYRKAVSLNPNYAEAYYRLALAGYDEKNPGSRDLSLNDLQRSANLAIKQGNLELYQRAIEWMNKMK